MQNITKCTIKNLTAAAVFTVLAGAASGVSAGAVGGPTTVSADNLLGTAIGVLILLGTVGITFGFIVAYANRKFAIEVNPLIHIVEDILPKGQCGACGYPGCMAYAEAVVLDPNVSPSLCTPGREQLAKIVGELTGKAAEAMEPRIAYVRCAGNNERSVTNSNYEGITDCVAANLMFGGHKLCKYGCLGFATCIKSCPFKAMEMSPDGLPIINPDKCTGCAKCAGVCPKKVIDMIPVETKVWVTCNSRDKGPVAKKACSVACIGCSICVKACPHQALKMDNNLAILEPHVCMEKCSDMVCLAKCPTKAIRQAIFGFAPGSEPKIN